MDATLKKTTSEYSDQIWDNVLTFTNSYGKHNLVVMGGALQDESFNSLGAQGLNFPIDHEQSWYINQSATKPVSGITDDGTRQYGMSYFGRISHNYSDKYLLYATMRADGSSKYQQKWGYFPTIGAGWVISEEKFLKDFKPVNF